MKKTKAALLIALVSATSYAEEKTAEELVARKETADITYRQLMEVMGGASLMIHDGIARENQQLVKTGANIILTHPAPKHKPWVIMEKSDQEGFKQSLLSFDKVLDAHATRAAEEARKGNWMEASEAAHELETSCIACHAMWKYKTK